MEKNDNGDGRQGNDDKEREERAKMTEEQEENARMEMGNEIEHSRT